MMVGLRQSCDLPQQVSVDHVGVGARVLRVLHRHTEKVSDTQLNFKILDLETAEELIKVK